MSIQDSSFTPTPSMDEFDDNETIDEIEVGEMVDLNNSQTDGSMAAGQSTEALEEPQNTGYGRGSRPKKSIVHKEMLCITLPDDEKVKMKREMSLVNRLEEPEEDALQYNFGEESVAASSTIPNLPP
ncbi:hypothetical protein LIER_41250 [Lithospermum erythrorhizon]|uniref:Uncharacterized protein n=1 Tax=Lithospermum erythrorhizon TaxID=34254 RepID=A0AAV3R9R3_LITER